MPKNKKKTKCQTKISLKDKYAFILKNRFLLLIILIIGGFLRLFKLDHRDFWYDEAFTGIAVKESFTDMLNMIINDVHPPLYYVSLKIFSLPFDYSVFSIRLFSALFGILGIITVYLFCLELFGRKRPAVFASFLTAISPFIIQYSREGRMYSFFAFLVLIAYLFFIKALKTKQTKYYILWGVFWGLSALTHYMGIIFSVVYLISFLVWHTKKKIPANLEKKLKTKITKQNFNSQTKRILNYLKNLSFYLIKKLFNFKFLAGPILALIIFGFWIPTFFKHLNLKSDSLDWITKAQFYDIFLNLQIFLLGTPLGEMSSGMPGPNDLHFASSRSVLIVLTIALSIVIYYLSKKFPRKTLMLLVPSLGFMLIIYILSLMGKRYFVARYLLPSAYFLMIILGFYLSRLKLKFAFLGLTFYIIILMFTKPVGFSTGWNLFHKNLDQYENKNFYILNSFDYVIAKYYLGADNLTLYNIDWPIYNPSYWAAIGDSLKRTENINDIKQDPQAVIISNTQLKGIDNQNFDPSDYELIESYNNIYLYRVKR
jgi:uncharacterized membrane protein